MLSETTPVTPYEFIARACRPWVEAKRTGKMIVNWRSGRPMDVEHQHREWLDQEPKSARRAQVPVCPACGEEMTAYDSGTAFRCEACGVKRTAAQLKVV